MTASARASDPATWTDAHLHAWSSSSDPRAGLPALAPPWLSVAPQFAGRFDLPRYFAEGGPRAAVVLVEADMDPEDRLREAQWLAAAGDASGLPWSTVAGIEPGRGSFGEECATVAQVRGVRGARRVLHAAEVPFATEAFRRDLASLAARGVAFDFCVRWADLALVEHHARGLPDAALVLDHLGNPPLQAGWGSPERIEWQRLLARVAACPGVGIKWSAMFENAGRALSRDEARPWFEWALECFGADRMMWGSNWPVCFARARLDGWIALSAELAGSLGLREQASLFGGTAQRIYRPRR